MKISPNTQIPDLLVFGILYAAIFGISIWLLVFHSESPNNWILYVAMILAIFMGIVKLAVSSRKGHPRSA